MRVAVALGRQVYTLDELVDFDELGLWVVRRRRLLRGFSRLAP